MGSGRKKVDTAALEDRDKPYACDSESSCDSNALTKLVKVLLLLVAVLLVSSTSFLSSN